MGCLNSPIRRTSFTDQGREFAALVVAVGRDFTSIRFFIESVHVLLEDGPAKRNENKTFEPRNGSLLTFVDRMTETRIFGRAFKRNPSLGRTFRSSPAPKKRAREGQVRKKCELVEATLFPRNWTPDDDPDTFFLFAAEALDSNLDSGKLDSWNLSRFGRTHSRSDLSFSLPHPMAHAYTHAHT